MLEVGCGHGAVTRELVDRLRCRVTAVDIDRSCRPHVQQSGAAFVHGDVTSREVLDQLDDDYDFVLAMDVLEHLADPVAALKALSEHASDDALFIITLPNVAVWHVRLPFLTGRWDYTDGGTLDRTHLRFFTPRSAVEMVVEAGFDVCHVDYSWNVPVLAKLCSTAALCQSYLNGTLLEPGRQKRRLSTLEHSVIVLHRMANALGWLRGLNRLGRRVARSSPSLWRNHVLISARPR